MQAKILIKRKFQTGKKKEILSVLRELRARAMDQPGYISGQTLASPDDPQLMLIIGTWQDLESWHKWSDNPTRQALEQILESYQLGPTDYQEFILGGFIED
jgi:heme-degrading monooxygenase HmoA